MPIDVSGFGHAAIDPAGRVADWFVTTMPDVEGLECFRRGGGGRGSGHGPAFAGTKVRHGTDRDEAVRTVHHRRPNTFPPGEPGQVLPTPPTSSGPRDR